MSFDEIFDLTAGVYFHFYNILTPGIINYNERTPFVFCSVYGILETPGRVGNVFSCVRVDSLGID